MMGRLPARFRRHQPTPDVQRAQEAEDLSAAWEVLDRVSKEDALADAEPIDALRHEREHCIYQLNRLGVAYAKGEVNLLFRARRTETTEQIALYRKRIEQIDHTLMLNQESPWIRR